MRGMIRSLGVVGLALLSVVGLAVAWTAATVVQLTATALIMGGTGHPLSCRRRRPRTTSSRTWTTRSRCFINPAADAPTGTGGTRSTGWARATRSTRSPIPRSSSRCPASRRSTRPCDAGRANLNGCVRGTSVLQFNGQPPTPTDPPSSAITPGPDDFVVFGYSQSAVVASLVKQDLIAEPPRADTDVSFFLLANPMRPNGGILSRGTRGSDHSDHRDHLLRRHPDEQLHDRW